MIVDASGGDLGLDVWLVCLAAAGFAGLALFIALRVYVSQQVTTPVVELTEAARAVSTDQLERLEPLVVRGAPEIAELGAAFEGMLERVADYVNELERSRTEFRRAVSRLGDALASTHDRQAIVEVVLETGALLVDAAGAVFFLAAGPELVARAGHGIDGWEGTTFKAGDGVAGWALLHDEVAVCPYGPHSTHPDEPSVDTAVAVPIHSQNRVFGVLAVYGKTSGRRFTNDDIDSLKAFARQAEAAIDNTFLHDEASRLSITDGLTGVWNRRYFDMQCAQEVERAQRFEEPFSLVMVDIDAFKGVNDEYGHQAGDAILVDLARRLVEATREVDRVARFGGEEFALLLPRTDCVGAERLAEKVRSSVAEVPFVTDHGSLWISVSLGVACHPDHGGSVRELVAAADEALYRAKASGKNRVERSLRS